MVIRIVERKRSPSPAASNGVAAKFESRPSSWRFETMTSPGPAACGRISHEAALSGGTAAHQCAGYADRGAGDPAALYPEVERELRALEATGPAADTREPDP